MAMTGYALRVCLLQTLLALAPALVLRGDDAEDTEIGQVDMVGVTRYSKRQIVAVKKRNREFGDNWWPGPDGHARDREQFYGAQDLAENISWGWHHPNGVFNTIPVGGPMIDGDMNIYLATDDAIRKFSPIGTLVWSYAPRGQLAAAPTLLSSEKWLNGTGRTEPEVDVHSAEEEDALEAEEELRPDWAQSKKVGKVQLVGDQVKVGDRLKVRPGMGYHKDGIEYFRAGDKGRVTNVTMENGEERAWITWPRTGYESVAGVVTLSKRFLRLKRQYASIPAMLVSSTTTGYVFALSPETGEELWATKVAEMTEGVKGVVTGHKGVIVSASNKCINRLCYRYRNQTDPLVNANTMVRALDATDGSIKWSYEPVTPVWNFQPYFYERSNTDYVTFTDMEAGGYFLELGSGTVQWYYQGTLGTYTEAAGVYSHDTQQLYLLGHMPYYLKDEACNPAGAPGVKAWCHAWPQSPGYVRAVDSRTGYGLWQTNLPEVPSTASIAHLSFQKMHWRLLVNMGYPCTYQGKSKWWILDTTGQPRLMREGPTMWASDCAGEVEAGDVRGATGGRRKCYPAAWTAPATDRNGDLYMGNQVGVIQKFTSFSGTGRDVQVVSTLDTHMAFQENAIAFAPGMMAVATCSSLIVFTTTTPNDLEVPYISNTTFGQDKWSFNTSQY